MNLTSASTFKCIQRGLPSVFASFCHAFRTFQLIPGRFHGFCSSLTTVLKQILLGVHLYCRHWFSMCGCNPNGFCTCQQLSMHSKRFAQRFRAILPRFHDIPADTKQCDIRFEANSSRFSPLLQALVQHARVQSRWILHLPSSLNVFKRVYPAFSPHFETFS